MEIILFGLFGTLIVCCIIVSCVYNCVRLRRPANPVPGGVGGPGPGVGMMPSAAYYGGVGMTPSAAYYGGGVAMTPQVYQQGAAQQYYAPSVGNVDNVQQQQMSQTT